jgi:hypothetical protein
MESLTIFVLCDSTKGNTFVCLPHHNSMEYFHSISTAQLLLIDSRGPEKLNARGSHLEGAQQMDITTNLPTYAVRRDSTARLPVHWIGRSLMDGYPSPIMLNP